MIQSFLETITILTSNSSAISFMTDDVRTRRANCCGWLQHEQGSPLYKILEGGLYDISFNVNVTSATVGVVAFGLYEDGILIPGSTVIATITTPGDYVNLSFRKLKKICCKGDATITVQSVPSVLTGATLLGTPTDTEIPIIQNANVLIDKEA